MVYGVVCVCAGGIIKLFRCSVRRYLESEIIFFSE